MSMIQQVERLASGQVRFHLNQEADKFIEKAVRNGKITVSPKVELYLWKCFDTLCKELSPKCKFNRDGISNNAEKRRRNAMFGIIRMVNFRSQNSQIELLFKRNFGKVSLAWMMVCCGTDAPPFYYEWAFDAIQDITSKVWGPKALLCVEGSWPHMEVFRKLAPAKFDLLAVKKVMES
jgi:hypothetical protein